MANQTLNYKRKILRCLAEEYNIHDARFLDTDHHSAVTFTHDGRSHQVTLHKLNGSQLRRESNLISMKLQDIRRVLGPSIHQPAKQKPQRSLKQMIKEVTTLAENSGLLPTRPPQMSQSVFVCRMSLLLTGRRTHQLLFRLPDQAIAALSNRIDLKYKPPWTWELASQLHGKLSVGKRGIVISTKAVPTDKTLFGMSSAECLVSKGVVIVNLDPNNRKPINVNKQRKNTGLIPHISPTQLQEQAQDLQPAQSQPTATISTMRSLCIEALSLLRKVEAETPFRLVRVRQSDNTTTWKFVVDPVE